MQKNVSSTYVDQGSRKSASTIAFIRNQRRLGYKNKKAQIQQPRMNLNMKLFLPFRVSSWAQHAQ